MSGSLTWGRILAAFIGVYHLWVGVTLIVSGETSIRLARSIAGWTIAILYVLGIAACVWALRVARLGARMAAEGRQ